MPGDGVFLALVRALLVTVQNLFGMNGLEEIVQFILEGAFDHIHEEEDHVVERQQPLSNEIFG